jgi:hypothetical protein
MRIGKLSSVATDFIFSALLVFLIVAYVRNPFLANIRDVSYPIPVEVSCYNCDSIMRRVKSYEEVRAVELFILTKLAYHQEWLERESDKILRPFKNNNN